MKAKRSFVEQVDQIIFIKKGYSIWKHLVPFSIAALLLLVLSLPSNNLLLSLVDKLGKPSLVWIPAALLTCVACVAYVAFLYRQIRQAYLWTDGALRRSLTTAIVYLLLCASMAYGVLAAFSPTPLTWNSIWACVLLSALSLAGIGWDQPDSWVKSLGVQMPDYTDARAYSKRLSNLVSMVRRKSIGEKDDIEYFLTLSKDLREEVEKNQSLEPIWALPYLEVVSNDFLQLIQSTEKSFPKEDQQAVHRFTSACNFKMESNYPDFVRSLKTVSSYWISWKYSERSLR